MEEKESKGKKVVKVIAKVIYNIAITIITLFILFEVIIGIVNMNKISNDEEPVWYLDKVEEETLEKKETKYDLGLYKIVKTIEAGKMKTILKPFFIK